MKKASSPPHLSRLCEAAVDAAQAAGKVLIKHFGSKLQISEKVDAGLVTNADLAAEKKAMGVLGKAFPEFGFLTEERDPILSPSPGRWIIDPLDGTTNYVHGYPMFCVSIAAEWNGKVVVGVIYHPILKNLYVGVRGQGAHLNGKRLQVSNTRHIQDALLTTGFSYEKGTDLPKELDAFRHFSQEARAIRRPGSAALDLAYTAQGVFDGYWERSLSPWDVAAGALLVQEAGGKVTGFCGESFRVDHRSFLATNGKLHSCLLKTLSIV